MEIKNMKMFLAMRDIFYGGEFSAWLNKQTTIPGAALKEFDEAEKYFRDETGFDLYEEDDEKLKNKLRKKLEEVERGERGLDFGPIDVERPPVCAAHGDYDCHSCDEKGL